MALVHSAKTELRPLLKLNDELRELASLENDINVPSIVAVGDQSHGKSSVIEGLSGIDLPRGEGIQTRLPLVLKLRSCNQGEERALISAEGIPEQSVSLKDIADKVRIVTQQVAGEGKDVVDKEVIVTVFQRDQDDLTLIDLPGMTRVAVDDQHEDIEETISAMYKRYMLPEEAILLNVVSAMVDFSTSKSLKLSRDFDSNGKRSMLCITKLDQHKEPGVACKIQKAAEQLHLKPEHVFCVRNRSQQENDQALDLIKTRELENDFFSDHAELRTLSKETVGIAALSHKLVVQQYQRILATLPAASSKVDARISELEDALAKLGTMIESEFEARAVFQQCLTNLSQSIEAESSGHAHGRVTDVEVAGKSLEVHVNIENMKQIRKDTKFGKSIKGPTVNVADVEVCLSIYPNINADWEEDKDKGKYTVGVFLNVVLPRDVTSLRMEYALQAMDAGQALIKSCEGIHDFEKTGGFGHREFFDHNTADRTEAVSFCGQVYIQSIQRLKEKTTCPALCAQVHQKNKTFANNVNQLYSNRHFFSGPFHQDLKAKFEASLGAQGLPGTLGPEVALRVLRNLRAKLPGVVNSHVQAIAAVAQDAWKRLSKKNFAEYPELEDVITSVVAEKFAAQRERALDMTQQILAWEESFVHTENHYFMDIVQQLRKVISGSGSAYIEIPSDFAFLSQDDVRNVRKLSNEDQRIIDVQIELFAYWKVMKKRLIDYVQMCCRHELIQRPLSGMLVDSIQSAVEDRSGSDGGLAMLMAPSQTKRNAIIATKERLNALRKAQVLLKSAPSLRTLSTTWCGSSGSSLQAMTPPGNQSKIET